ncbi:hypothetical protein PRIPAC_91427, partial [Pristionchus pacificus]|uniref:Uncharacterized protein n=1 Tax=Pristionchus pacificus TaxID=54126 RepID=A0A2A6CXB9_PRIPA
SNVHRGARELTRDGCPSTLSIRFLRQQGLGQWNKCIEQVINESYEILVSTICVKSIKGNSPVMGSRESGDENGTKGIMDNARDTATTTRIIRDYAITTKSQILWMTAYEKSITVGIREPCFNFAALPPLEPLVPTAVASGSDLYRSCPSLSLFGMSMIFDLSILPRLLHIRVFTVIHELLD